LGGQAAKGIDPGVLKDVVRRHKAPQMGGDSSVDIGSKSFGFGLQESADGVVIQKLNESL
jgi:hypothetical protein